ncbi:DUF1614 domain-containing protein [Planctomicrobium piriforme]|uniref:Uncharacterized membrane protein n=1 Tax=Planctomicrobium piriforme TaxID=1576369 RepID=A0A1I3RSA0_9PLAN|nr:DUF1614 domain-containing protein [Planctomicrobium piriforme]SFJ48147.1 Uncharacterized membrane protein [Planctomicrobium piriforme]
MPVQIRYLGGPTRQINPLLGCLPLFIILLVLCLLPLFLFDTARYAFERLGLHPMTAALTVFGIMLGSVINIPVYHIRKDELQPMVPFGPLGMALSKTYQRVQSETLIAVNLGGCVIPTLIAVLQAVRLLKEDSVPFLCAMLVSAVCVVACWRVARPVEGIGILIPAFVPPLVSVLTTWMVLLPLGAGPEQRAATAFIAGVAGPIIGADLLHLKEMTKTPVAVMSIGGAGTFDGIVLSGILAALLA